jgi:hypothetical protein
VAVLGLSASLQDPFLKKKIGLVQGIEPIADTVINEIDLAVNERVTLVATFTCPLCKR